MDNSCDCDTMEERAHFLSIIKSFQNYRHYALEEVEKTHRYFRTLPAHHQAMMKEYNDHLNEVKRGIIHNDMMIQMVLESADNFFANVNLKRCGNCMEPDVPNRDMASDIPRIEAVLKHVYRDWSLEGIEERRLCYRPILEELLRFHPEILKNPGCRNVLVPGAGLGRLVHDIAKLGFKCQGNEFSLFMMFFSQFVLNRCTVPHQYHLYPWIHQSTNNQYNCNQTQKVTFPDVSPSDLAQSKGSVSMAAGDFLEVYKKSDSWDCVATCFFIDCAHNIVEFIERIYKILRPGGHWINIGPLLYHYSNLPDENSIEPSYQDIREVIEKIGFIFETEHTNQATFYCQNPNSIMQLRYNSVFFSCVKPINPDDQPTTSDSKATELPKIEEEESSMAVDSTDDL